MLHWDRCLVFPARPAPPDPDRIPTDPGLLVWGCRLSRARVQGVTLCHDTKQQTETNRNEQKRTERKQTTTIDRFNGEHKQNTKRSKHSTAQQTTTTPQQTNSRSILGGVHQPATGHDPNNKQKRTENDQTENDQTTALPRGSQSSEQQTKNNKQQTNRKRSIGCLRNKQKKQNTI